MEHYSVLTTVYVNDKAEYLIECVDSILEQSVQTDDYVIVKDGPLTKELDEVISKYQDEYPIFQIVSLKKNVGLGPALNAGLEVCKNELVARLDADDIAMPKRCEMQLDMFSKHVELDIVGSYMYEFSSDKDIVESVKKMPRTHEEVYQFGKRRNPFNHSTVMYKKTAVQDNGGYSDRRRAQDLELFTKMLFNGCRAMNIDTPLVKFRAGDSRYRRKRSWNNIRSDIAVAHHLYKIGYSGLSDFMYFCTAHLTMFILPTAIGQWLYNKIFRTKIV